MQEYVTITAEFTIEDDQLEAQVANLRAALQESGYDSSQLEIVVTHLGDDVWPPPVSITSINSIFVEHS